MAKGATNTWNWPALARWSVLAALIFGLDQYTKYWIQHRMIYGDVEPVTGFFNLVVAYNTGAAFSFLADAGGWQRIFFSAFAFLAVFIISLMIARRSSQKFLCFGLTLVLAGALGNVYDRIFLGHVVDFLDFHWAGYHWPAFNVADIAICVGAAIIVLIEFLSPQK